MLWYEIEGSTWCLKLTVLIQLLFWFYSLVVNTWSGSLLELHWLLQFLLFLQQSLPFSQVVGDCFFSLYVINEYGCSSYLLLLIKYFYLLWFLIKAVKILLSMTVKKVREKAAEEDLIHYTNCILIHLICSGNVPYHSLCNFLCSCKL